LDNRTALFICILVSVCLLSSNVFPKGPRDGDNPQDSFEANGPGEELGPEIKYLVDILMNRFDLSQPEAVILYERIKAKTKILFEIDGNPYSSTRSFIMGLEAGESNGLDDQKHLALVKYAAGQAQVLKDAREATYSGRSDWTLRDDNETTALLNELDSQAGHPRSDIPESVIRPSRLDARLEALENRMLAIFQTQYELTLTESEKLFQLIATVHLEDLEFGGNSDWVEKVVATVDYLAGPQTEEPPHFEVMAYIRGVAQNIVEDRPKTASDIQMEKAALWESEVGEDDEVFVYFRDLIERSGGIVETRIKVEGELDFSGTPPFPVYSEKTGEISVFITLDERGKTNFFELARNFACYAVVRRKINSSVLGPQAVIADQNLLISSVQTEYDEGNAKRERDIQWSYPKTAMAVTGDRALYEIAGFLLVDAEDHVAAIERELLANPYGGGAAKPGGSQSKGYRSSRSRHNPLDPSDHPFARSKNHHTNPRGGSALSPVAMDESPFAKKHMRWSFGGKREDDLLFEGLPVRLPKDVDRGMVFDEIYRIILRHPYRAWEDLQGTLQEIGRFIKANTYEANYNFEFSLLGMNFDRLNDYLKAYRRMLDIRRF